MDRSAVAATLVSVIVFTSLLVANSVLFSSGNSAVSASVLSAEQVRERTFADVLLGVATFDSLDRVQGYLGENPLDCGTPGGYLSSIAGNQTVQGDDTGLDYSVMTSWSYAQAPPGASGSEFLPGFSGFEPGDLNVQVTSGLAMSFLDGLPSYSVESDEVMHLSVPLGTMVSSCLAALSDLRSALSTLSACDSSAVNREIELASSTNSFLGSYDAGASPEPTAAGCSVYYWVTTTVGGLEGVTGAFQMTVRGEGSLEIGTNPGSQPSLA